MHTHTVEGTTCTLHNIIACACKCTIHTHTHVYTRTPNYKLLYTCLTSCFELRHNVKTSITIVVAYGHITVAFSDETASEFC